MQEFQLKTSVIGDHEVGKSSLIKILSNNAKAEWLSSIVYGGFMTYYERIVEIEGKQIKLMQHYWEIDHCKSKEAYITKAWWNKNFFSGAKLILLVFDLTKESSINFIDDILGQLFSNVFSYHEEIKDFKFPQIILIGTFSDKLDNSDQQFYKKIHDLTIKIGKNYSPIRENIPFFKVSSILNEGVDEYNKEILNLVQTLLKRSD